MIRFLYLVAIVVLGLLFLLHLFMVIGSFVGLHFGRSRAAKLPCPHCKRPIGTQAVITAIKLDDEHQADFIRGLNLQENECVDIHFRSLLPVVCPHCQTPHEFDLDELGIGPLR